MDLYVKLAKETVENFVKTGSPTPPVMKLPEKFFKKKAGVFVSIHTKSGELRGLLRRRAPRLGGASVLRGCIGTFLPTKENIAEEIIANAISSCSSDPRFWPVNEEELPNLTYSVDVLSSPKNVSKVDYIDVKKYGLIVSTTDGRRGLLLPDLEGVDTPEEQFRICCLKGGIDPQEEVNLQVFTVERHGKH